MTHGRETLQGMLGSLSGYTIGVTADRRSDEQISMLSGRGATCIHGPTIRTHPLRPEEEIRTATEAILASPPDIVILTTGIGIRGWLDAADLMALGEPLRASLAGATLLSRGPKARGAALTVGLHVDWSTPNSTSQEIIDHLTDSDLVGRTVAVQLDGAGGELLLAWQTR